MSAEILFKWLAKCSLYNLARKVLKLSFFVCTEPVHSSWKFVIFKELYPVLLAKVSPSNHSLFCVCSDGFPPLNNTTNGTPTFKNLAIFLLKVSVVQQNRQTNYIHLLNFLIHRSTVTPAAVIVPRTTDAPRTGM